MSLQKKITADLLFGVQTVCTFIFGGSQFLRMLTTTQGVSISWFACWEMFLVLNLVLAVNAHRVQPSRVTRQTVFTYSLWVTMVTLNLAVMLWKNTGVWKTLDSITVVLASIGIAITLVVASQQKRGITDPIVKGYLAIFFKAIPQFTLAYNIFMLGGAGLAAATVWNGHITVLTRIGQLYFSIREAGWDRNRIGSAISELANEGSWIIVTIVWLTA